MTIEEKARAYDEAIKIARIWKDKSGMPKDKQGILDDIFPELRESEDEKIRKALIDYFDDANKADENPLQSYGIHTDKAIAWLEKRSEPTDINPSEFDLRLNKLLKRFETLPKEELASSLSFYLNVVQNDGTYKADEKQDKQNPCETCEEPRLNCQNFPCDRKRNFDSANKVEPKFRIGDVLCDKSCTTLNKDAQPNFKITDIRNGLYICDKCSFPISQQDEYDLVKILNIKFGM